MTFSALRHAGIPALLLLSVPLLETTLEPRTVAEFETYVKRVEQQLAARWDGHAYFAFDEVADERKKLLDGELWIKPGSINNPVNIYNGLVHDWVGAIFLPDASLEKVLGILQDFNRHAEIYPEVTRSRIVRREGNEIAGYWRLERKDQLIPVVLDVEQEAHWKLLGQGRWTCRAYARDIREVENAGGANETDLPVGKGMGLLWRLYAYWTLEETDGGVLAECRTLSLSRGVPSGMTWIIRPFLQSVPRESLASMLKSTKQAVMEK